MAQLEEEVRRLMALGSAAEAQRALLRSVEESVGQREEGERVGGQRQAALEELGARLKEAEGRLQQKEQLLAGEGLARRAAEEGLGRAENDNRRLRAEVEALQSERDQLELRVRSLEDEVRVLLKEGSDRNVSAWVTIRADGIAQVNGNGEALRLALLSCWWSGLLRDPSLD